MNKNILNVVIGLLGGALASTTALQDVDHLTWQTGIVAIGSALLTWALRSGLLPRASADTATKSASSGPKPVS